MDKENKTESKGFVCNGKACTPLNTPPADNYFLAVFDGFDWLPHPDSGDPSSPANECDQSKGCHPIAIPGVALDFESRSEDTIKIGDCAWFKCKCPDEGSDGEELGPAAP